MAGGESGFRPLDVIVRGVEPGDRVESKGTIYVESIRGVPGGVDLWRWSQPIDGAPNANGTLPFKYEGQPDNCGLFGLTGGCCVNNVPRPPTPRRAPGGRDRDFPRNRPPPHTTPNPTPHATTLPLP